MRELYLEYKIVEQGEPINNQAKAYIIYKAQGKQIKQELRKDSIINLR